MSPRCFYCAPSAETVGDVCGVCVDKRSAIGRGAPDPFDYGDEPHFGDGHEDTDDERR